MSKNAKKRLRATKLEMEHTKVPAPSECPIPNLTMEGRLRSMITGLLGGPTGDPDKHHMLAAAHCCLLLEQIGSPYRPKDSDDDTLGFLAGENIFEVDFMRLAREDASI